MSLGFRQEAPAAEQYGFPSASQAHGVVRGIEHPVQMHAAVKGATAQVR